MLTMLLSICRIIGWMNLLLLMTFQVGKQFSFVHLFIHSFIWFVFLSVLLFFANNILELVVFGCDLEAGN